MLKANGGVLNNGCKQVVSALLSGRDADGLAQLEKEGNATPTVAAMVKQVGEFVDTGLLQPAAQEEKPPAHSPEAQPAEESTQQAAAPAAPAASNADLD